MAQEKTTESEIRYPRYPNSVHLKMSLISLMASVHGKTPYFHHPLKVHDHHEKAKFLVLKNL